MRLGFVYNQETLRRVGYRTTMDVDQTFGEVLDEICAMFNWNVHDYVFFFKDRFTKVQRHWRPREMGMKDEDYMKIYCVLRTNPMLLSSQANTA